MNMHNIILPVEHDCKLIFMSLFRPIIHIYDSFANIEQDAINTYYAKIVTYMNREYENFYYNYDHNDNAVIMAAFKNKIICIDYNYHLAQQRYISDKNNIVKRELFIRNNIIYA